ncbi:MAG: hypothetical protein L6R28_06860 [Planctomycetes bacterium]|nr:hypothetical protein [Planctomycetota bacterium]
MTRLLIVFLAMAACTATVRAGEPIWAKDLDAARAEAARAKKPVLLLVQDPRDPATLDAAMWIEASALRGKFVCVKARRRSETLDALSFPPQKGLLFLTAESERIAFREISGALDAVLAQVLKDPRALDVRLAEALAKPGYERMAVVSDLSACGLADHALRLMRAIEARSANSRPFPGILGEPSPEVLVVQARVDAATRLRYLQRGLARLLEAKEKEEDADDDGADATVRVRRLADARERLAYLFEDDAEGAGKDLREAFAAARKAWAAAGGKAPDAGTLKPLAEQLPPFVEKKLNEAQAAQAIFLQKYAHLPQAFRARAALLKALLAKHTFDSDERRQADRLLDEMLNASPGGDALLEAAEVLAVAVLQWRAFDARKALYEKLRKEAPSGRGSAAALLRLAEAAIREAGLDEAKEYLKAAERAAADGESPVLYAAARALRATVEGKDSPWERRWAKRKVYDVVALAPDRTAYLEALAQWDDKYFFPVLFLDDRYAPMFIRAFRPQLVVVLPSTLGVQPELSLANLRGVLLKSWTREKEVSGLPRNPSGDDLRARLDAVGDGPQGVVFADGNAGEWAGGLALAAGRFQGLEALPAAAKGHAEILDEAQAWALAADVRAGLRRWGLPNGEGHWTAATLAIDAPYRYRGERYGIYGTTYALDDLLGRDENGVRLAVTGRLIGNEERSCYQAMCSLFLEPGKALFFNTYPQKAGSAFEDYRLDAARGLLQQLVPSTLVQSNDATLANFRKLTAAPNPFGVVWINSSGGAKHWSIGGDGKGGKTEDFPVGAPAAFTVVHSGSAADPYDTSTLAGRALDGGAYFYFGAVSEPFLAAFQPAGRVVPLMLRGAPLGYALRQHPPGGFWQPWRLMVAGDPLCALREKGLERKEFKADKGPLVMRGEQFLPAKKFLEGK